MNQPWPWQCLGIDQTASVREVKRRYAELLKLNRPEDNPLGFQQLRHAYGICLEHARERENATGADGVREGHPSAPPPREGVGSEAHPHLPEVADTIPPIACSVEPLQGTEMPGRDSDFSPDAIPAVPPVPARFVHGTAQPAHAADTARTQAIPLTPVVAVPDLRSAADVADVLLALDATSPPDSDAFERHFAECPELASFVSRNDVELALLQRIVNGARPRLRALQQFGTAFGWRQLGHERHLLALGVPRDALPRIDEALFRAGAEAQFDWHVASGPRLIPSGEGTIGVTGEARLLRELRERRDTPPGFRALLSAQRLNRVNRLLDGWSQRYGNAATLYLFGSDSVSYWRSARPGAPATLRQSLAGIVRAARTFGWFLLGLLLIGIAATLQSPERGIGQLVETMAGTLAIGLTAIVIVGFWRLATRRLSEFVEVTDAAHEAWRERRFAGWLAPARAIPLGIALGLLLGIAAHGGHVLAALGVAAAISAVVFGWRSLAALPLHAGAAWLIALACSDPRSMLPWLAAAAVPLPTLWFSDWLARRQMPHDPVRVRWRRIAGYSMLYGIFALMLGVAGVAVFNALKH